MKKPLELKPLFLERMKKIFSNKKDFQSYLKSIESEPPISIRCNTLKISPDELKKRLENKGWKIKQPFKDNPEIMIVEGKFADKNDDNEEKDANNKSSDDAGSNKHNSYDKVIFSIKNSSENLIPLEPG